LGDALVDFTSGVTEFIDLEDQYRGKDEEIYKELFKDMSAEIEEHALMCCAIRANDSGEMEQRTELGLVKGHAYGITAVRKVTVKDSGLMSFFR